jgi:hypothetical protein
MFIRILLATVFAASIAAGQFIGSTPIGVTRPGATSANDPVFGRGSTTFPNNAAPRYIAPVHPLPPDPGYSFPYILPEHYMPIHGYGDLARRMPSPQIAPSLLPPETPKTKAWDAIRSDYALAAVRVSAARKFVDELRAQQEEMGLTTDANLLANTSNAENALKTAREAMAAQDIDRSRAAIRQASGLAQAVLKEFGH